MDNGGHCVQRGQCNKNAKALDLLILPSPLVRTDDVIE
jgi:hypothetical protein